MAQVVDKEATVVVKSQITSECKTSVEKYGYSRSTNQHPCFGFSKETQTRTKNVIKQVDPVTFDWTINTTVKTINKIIKLNHLI